MTQSGQNSGIVEHYRNNPHLHVKRASATPNAALTVIRHGADKDSGVAFLEQIADAVQRMDGAVSAERRESAAQSRNQHLNAVWGNIFA